MREDGPVPRPSHDLADLLADLRRAPDLEGPNLEAHDAADRLILDETAPSLARDLEAGPGPGPGPGPEAEPPTGTGVSDVVVLGDTHGALSLGLAALGARVSVATDSVLGESAIAENAQRAGLAERVQVAPLGPDLLAGARLVAMRLPRALAELAEVSELIAQHADPGVRVVAGGREKYLTRRMNEVLERSFTEVRASLGRQKSRVLHAVGARTDGPQGSYPQRAEHLGLQVVAHGGAFGGTDLDLGTRYLLTFADRMAPEAATAADAGCGTGILAVALATARPDLQVTASDISASAVASARETARANGVEDRVTAVRADALETLPSGSVDLVVCNPPFHSGAAVEPDAARGLLRDAGRVLASGGELWCVFNSRLARARELRRLVGPTEVMGDSGAFTVTRSVPRG